MKFLLSLVWSFAAFATAAQAQYPTRAITIVVPFGAGGVADITARTVGVAMSKLLKQPVVIEPGAGNIVGSAAVARAAPDGHTLLPIFTGNAVSVGLFKNLPYDPVNESGLPQYNAASWWNGLAAPAGTPGPVIDKLDAAMREAVQSPDVQRRLQALGVRAQASTPQELGRLLSSEIQRVGAA